MGDVPTCGAVEEVGGARPAGEEGPGAGPGRSQPEGAGGEGGRPGHLLRLRLCLLRQLLLRLLFPLLVGGEPVGGWCGQELHRLCLHHRHHLPTPALPDPGEAGAPPDGGPLLLPLPPGGRQPQGPLQAPQARLHLVHLQCSAVQCSAVQCSAVQCSAVQCSAVQCSAVQCSAVQWGGVSAYSGVRTV
jgi:hypothetical protein